MAFFTFFRFLLQSDERHNAFTQCQGNLSPDLGEIWVHARLTAYGCEVRWSDLPPDLQRTSDQRGRGKN